MQVEVLGTAQDGGVPHLGCPCRRCEAARADPERRRYAASLLVHGGGVGVVGGGDGAGRGGGDSNDDAPESTGGRVLVDATPDVRWQVSRLPDRVVLTHAHVGHLGGLPLFGREAGGARDLPVHCTPGLADLLRSNEPLRSLVERGHVVLHPFSDGDRMSVGDCDLVARAVEHRDELGTGTLSLRVEGPERSLYYVPDVDRLTGGVRSEVRNADVALVDATFWSADEIAGYESVPHPTGRELVEVFGDVETEVYLTHLNHTNPLLDGESAERERVREAGLAVVERGQTFGLG